MSWSKILKNRSEVSSHILQNSKPFLHQIGTESGFYMTAGDGHLKGWPRSSKALPKAPNLHKKDHGHCLVVCCQSDPLQLSEPWWNHYLWEVCSANWWDAVKTAMAAVGIGQQKGPSSSPWQCPTACHVINGSKVEQIGLWSFASVARFTWPCINRLPFLQASRQLFAGKAFHNQQEAENAFQELTESWREGFHATGINTFISHWQKCVDCNHYYFD